VKITITNFNYIMNYSDWNIVAQHPNFNNLSQIFSFNYKSLDPYASMILHCFGESNTTMICCWNLDRWGMSSPNCCSRRINKHSL
jgi:hypothetical protein